jgi:LEA14-like dessication related protein
MSLALKFSLSSLPKPALALLLLPALSLGLSSCASLTAVVRTPQFNLIEAGLSRFDPPGLDTPAQAVVRLELEGRNPNPFNAPVSEMVFDLFVDGQRVASGGTPGFTLLAGGSPSRVPVDVAVPVAGSSLTTLITIAKGETVSYRLEGSFRLDAGSFGKPKFGPYTLASGSFKMPSGPPLAPSFSWRSDLTRLTLGSGGLVLDLAFGVSNPSFLGYRLIAPLALQVGNATVARAEAGGSIPAKGDGLLRTRFQIDPLAIAGALIGGRLDFRVSGAPTLEVPGLSSYVLPASLLFSGSAKR